MTSLDQPLSWSGSLCSPTPGQLALTRIPLRWPVRFLLFYLFLITVIGKGPTYLAFPPLYISEILMIVMLVWLVDRFGILRASFPAEDLLTYSVWLYVLAGIGITASCLKSGGMNALRDAAIWFYAAFYFIGIHLGKEADTADRIWRILGLFWILVLPWGTLDQLSFELTGRFLSQNGPKLPWRGEYLFSNSGNEIVEHMALGAMIVLSSNLHRGRFRQWQNVLVPLSLLALAVIAVSRGRGVKVGIALSALVLLSLKLAPGRMLQTPSKIAVAACIGLILVLGGLALFSDDFLHMTQLDRFAEADPSAPKGTAHWRMLWWKNLFHEVHKQNPLFGLGFGQSLNIYNPYLEGNEHEKWPVRSPHNFNITVFSRMGYVGAALWTLVLTRGIGGLIVRLWRGHWQGVPYSAFRREELAFWVVLLIITWGNATFGVLMEGPVLGVWFWFALGFAKARSEQITRPVPQLVSQ